MIYADIVIILILLIGFFRGWKDGILTSAIKFVSSILVFVAAYFLKGPISLILMDKLPFISFKGIFEGITAINIVIYEVLAFVIAIFVLSFVVKLIIKLTGILNKFINSIFIFELPNRIAGGLITAIRFYITIFFVVFLLNLVPYTSPYITSSKMGPKIINSTPILTDLMQDVNKSFNEIYKVAKEIDGETNKDEINKKAIGILLKYNVISVDTVKDLGNKIEVEDIDKVINEYKDGIKE